MTILRYLIFIAVILLNIRPVFGNELWDIVLLDVSSDMESPGKYNLNELMIANQCIKHFEGREMPDSIMLFAGGRAIFPIGDVSDNKYEYSYIRSIIGDGTSINDALTSCLRAARKSGRILVITNGRETGSSISSNTLSKLMKERGIKIDVIKVSSGCDSIFIQSAFDPNDSVRYERTKIYQGLKNIVKKTGGKILTIGETDNIDYVIKSFVSSIKNDDTRVSKKNCELNNDLVKKTLVRIKPQKLYICEVDTNVVIKYRGVKYYGLDDVLNVGKLDPFILIDHDSALNSGACNIVFTSEPTERVRKEDILHDIKPANSYCKLNQSTPVSVLPMMYYNGIGCKMLLCGLEYEEVEYEETE